MNASPILRMALVTRTVLGRRLASHAVYPQPLPGPPPRRPPVTDPPPPDRLPLPLSGADAPGPAAGRRLLADFLVRRLPAPAPRPLSGDRPAGPAGLAAGERTGGRDAEGAALAAGLPGGLRRRRQRLAIDLTLVPYHGLPFASSAFVYRSKARDGTSHFHAYATAYLLVRSQRFTLALTPVAKGEHLEEVLKRLKRRCGRLGIRPRLLLLDRGFKERGRRPLPASGAAGLPDAPAAAWPQGGPPRRAGRQQRLVLPGPGWLLHRHAAFGGRPDGAGVGVRQVPQLGRRAWAARSAAAGLRPRGVRAGRQGLGAANVPDAVRHRDELPAATAGACTDEQPQPVGAAAAGGSGAGPAKGVGVAARCRAVHSTARRTGAFAGAAAAGDDVELAAAGGPAT